jgi:hypothetical protein
MAFYNTTANWFTNIIITQTYLVWPFTIPQLTDLHKHNYNTELLSMAFYNTLCYNYVCVNQLVVVL